MIRARLTSKSIERRRLDPYYNALTVLSSSSKGGLGREYSQSWAYSLFGDKAKKFRLSYRVITSGIKPTYVYLVPTLRFTKVFIPPFFQKNTFFSLVLDLIYSPVTMSRFYWANDQIDSWDVVRPHLWEPFERLLKAYKIEGPVRGTYYRFNVYKGDDRLFSIVFTGVKYGNVKKSLKDFSVGVGVSRLSAYFDMYWDKFSGRYVYENVWGLKVDVKRSYGEIGRDEDCFLVNNYDVSGGTLKRTGIMVLCPDDYRVAEEFWFLPGLWWKKYDSPVQVQYFYVLADAPSYYMSRYIDVGGGKSVVP